MTPVDERLFFAAEQGNIAEAEAAISDGANVNARGPGELLPLQIAASHGNVAIARILIENGADVSAGNEWHKTPIIDGVKLGNILDIAVLLMEKGANFHGSKQRALKVSKVTSPFVDRMSPKHAPNNGRDAK